MAIQLPEQFAYTGPDGATKEPGEHFNAADANMLLTNDNTLLAAVKELRTPVVYPAGYVDGFPGGTQQQLFQFLFAAIGEGGGGGGTTPVRRAVLIVGQSNAQGTGGDTGTAPLSAITPSITAQYQRTRIVNPTTGLLEKLQFGVNNLGAIRDTTTGEYYSFGVELPLADFFQKKYPSDPYAVDIAKYAKGNTPIEHWDKANPNTGTGGGGYQATVAIIDTLKATHAEEGATTQWEFGYFRQGETSSTNWGTKFKAFDANLIADGKISSSFIWIVARVPGAIGLEQDQVALDLPGRFLLFDTNDAVLNSDLVHQTGRTVWVFGGTRATNRRYNTNVAPPFAMADATTPTPTTLAAGTVTANSVVWNWASGGNCLYILKRSTTADFSADVVEVFNGVGTTVTVSGLTASTPYYWRLTQQEAGKLISAAQAITQATPANSGSGEGAGANILPPLGPLWVSSNTSKIDITADRIYAPSDGGGQGVRVPLANMVTPWQPNTLYRATLDVVAGGGGTTIYTGGSAGTLNQVITQNGLGQMFDFTTPADVSNVGEINIVVYGPADITGVRIRPVSA